MLLVPHVGISIGRARPQAADVGGTRETLSYAACFLTQNAAVHMDFNVLYGKCIELWKSS